MAYVPKRLLVYSAEVKQETTYNTENAPAAATDAFYLQYDNDTVPEMVAEEFEFDGNLGPNAVGLGPNLQVAPSGRGARVEMPTYFRGGGAAYSASVFGKNRWHQMMLAAGYVGTLDATASSEKWTYVQAAPSVTPTSVTGYFWAKQLDGETKLERVKVTGGLADLKVDCANPQPPKFTFSLMGVYGDIADATFTDPTLAATPLPPLSTDLTFSYGSFTTAEVYGFNFALNRDLASKRVPLTSSGGHRGQVAGGYRPTLDVLIEQTKFADFNPYSIRAAASTAALALVNGSTQYNRVKFNGPQAQLIGIANQNRGRIPLWKLTFLLPPSTPAGTDSHNWVTD